MLVTRVQHEGSRRGFTTRVHDGVHDGGSRRGSRRPTCCWSRAHVLRRVHVRPLPATARRVGGLASLRARPRPPRSRSRARCRWVCQDQKLTLRSPRAEIAENNNNSPNPQTGGASGRPGIAPSARAFDLVSKTTARTTPVEILLPPRQPLVPNRGPVAETRFAGLL
jgi:hypothetical protein